METNPFLVNGTLLDEWSEHHRRLQEDGRGPLAGLFRGWHEPEFGKGKSGRKVLYIGKATSGDFDKSDDHQKAFDGNHAFWTFAREIARGLNVAESPASTLAWSNVSKITARTIRPAQDLLSEFGDLPLRTLNSEISELGVDTVVFVVHHFADHIVRSISEGLVDSQWNKSENESKVSDVWWRRRSDGVFVLWTNHPSGKLMTPETRQFAVQKIVHFGCNSDQ